jgi:calcineurin-like phosphoesterase family protein
MIYFTSDTHFCHNQKFIYEPRGFFSIEKHDKAIIENWNKIVNKNDIVYHLGDVMLNDNEKGLKYLKSLNGEIHIICGNHDSTVRREFYNTLPNVVEVCDAKTIKIGKQYYFLCHYPAITANYDDKPYHNHLINLFGHVHCKEKFYIPWDPLYTDPNPFMYNVVLDAHNCYPVSIEQINDDIHQKVQELYKEKQYRDAQYKKEYYTSGLNYPDLN